MERVKQNVKDVRKCLRYNLQLFGGTLESSGKGECEEGDPF